MRFFDAPPQVTMKLLCRAIGRWQRLQVATAPGCAHSARGGVPEPLARLTSTGLVASVSARCGPDGDAAGPARRRKARLTLKERGYIVSLVTNGLWAQARKAGAGTASSDVCLLCAERGALLHGHCDCAN